MEKTFETEKRLGLLFMFLIALFFPAYLAWEILIRQPQAAEVLHEQRVEEGIRLYAEFCAACHGNVGQGGVGKPLNRDDLADEKQHDFLFKTITRGRPGTAMPAWLKEEGGALDREQIESLVAFIIEGKSWGRVVALVPTPTPLPPDIDPVKAGEIYFTSTCFNCHGAGATGGIAPNLIESQFELTMPDDELRDWLLFEGRPDRGMPNWERTFSAEQIEKIIKYLRSLQRAAGTYPPPSG